MKQTKTTTDKKRYIKRKLNFQQQNKTNRKLNSQNQFNSLKISFTQPFLFINTSTKRFRYFALLFFFFQSSFFSWKIFYFIHGIFKNFPKEFVIQIESRSICTQNTHRMHRKKIVIRTNCNVVLFYFISIHFSME